MRKEHSRDVSDLTGNYGFRDGAQMPADLHRSMLAQLKAKGFAEGWVSGPFLISL